MPAEAAGHYAGVRALLLCSLTQLLLASLKRVESIKIRFPSCVRALRVLCKIGSPQWDPTLEVCRAWLRFFFQLKSWLALPGTLKPIMDVASR